MRTFLVLIFSFWNLVQAQMVYPFPGSPDVNKGSVNIGSPSLDKTYQSSDMTCLKIKDRAFCTKGAITRKDIQNLLEIKEDEAWTEWHGGNEIIPEFVAQKHLFIKFLIDLNRIGLIEENLAPEMIQLIQNKMSDVFTTSESIFLNTDEKVAVNFVDDLSPSKKILLINSSLWRGLSSETKLSLTMHEALLMAGYDDTRYLISQQFFFLFNLIKDKNDEYSVLKENNPDTTTTRDGYVRDELSKIGLQPITSSDLPRLK